jgi:hypothetical protein
VATTKPEPRNAFINVPYAKRYERVYLAFIAGIVGHGLVPTAAVRDPSSRYQLERIYELISAAQYIALMNVFGRRTNQPTFANLIEIYQEVERMARQIKRTYSVDLFDTRPFAELVYAANRVSPQNILSLVD